MGWVYQHIRRTPYPLASKRVRHSVQGLGWINDGCTLPAEPLDANQCDGPIPPLKGNGGGLGPVRLRTYTPDGRRKAERQRERERQTDRQTDHRSRRPELQGLIRATSARSVLREREADTC